MEKINTKINSLLQNALKTSRQFVASGDTEKACLTLQNFLIEVGEYAVILRELGRIKMLEKKPQEAVPLFERVLELIEADKVSFEQNSVNDDSSPITLKPDEEDNLSRSDLTYFEEISHEAVTSRSYYDFDEDSICDSVTVPQPEIINQNQKNEQEVNLFDTIPATLDFDASNNSLVDSSIELVSEDELLELAISDIVDDDPEYVIDEAVIDINNHVGYIYKYSWEEYEPTGVEYDDELEKYDFLNLATENKVTRLERARQIALEIGYEHDWDEDGINTLIDVFFKYGWSNTQKSIRREIELGLTPEELLLADQVRDIWREYPEYSETSEIPKNYRQRKEKTISDILFEDSNVFQKYFHLSWPTALILIRSYDKYPDPAEIEKLLIDLYDTWRNKASLIKDNHSFRHYIEYKLGHGINTLNSHLCYNFDLEFYDSQFSDTDNSNQLYKASELRKNLLTLGVDIESLDIHRIDSCKKLNYPNEEELDDPASMIESKDSPSHNIIEKYESIASYKVGEMVKINSGRFIGYEGKILNINEENQKLKILVSYSCQWKELTIKYTNVTRIL